MTACATLGTCVTPDPKPCADHLPHSLEGWSCMVSVFWCPMVPIPIPGFFGLAVDMDPLNMIPALTSGRTCCRVWTCSAEGSPASWQTSCAARLVPSPPATTSRAPPSAARPGGAPSFLCKLDSPSHHSVRDGTCIACAIGQEQSARPCASIVPRIDIPACLRSAAQASLTHLPSPAAPCMTSWSATASLWWTGPSGTLRLWHQPLSPRLSRLSVQMF